MGITIKDRPCDQCGKLCDKSAAIQASWFWEGLISEIYHFCGVRCLQNFLNERYWDGA